MKLSNPLPRGAGPVPGAVSAVLVHDGPMTSALNSPLVERFTTAARRVRQWNRAHPWILDIAVVAVLFLMFGIGDLVYPGKPVGPPEDPITFTHLNVAGTLALQAGLLLPLLWRRRAPVVAFAVIAAFFVLQWSLGVFLRADIALLIALYCVALYGKLRQLPWVCAVGIGVMVPLALGVGDKMSVWEAMFFLLSVDTAAVALGLVVRIRQAQLAGLRERAARLEIEREQRIELAAATERTRMAREMHDIIGHSLSVIITLADAGAYASEVTPERGTEALRLVGEAGRQALGELRRMLGMLHDPANGIELSPQPGIAELETLFGGVRTAGTEVLYRTGGEVERLDRGVQLTVYRIVQEALTNTLKHAGPGSRAEVTLTVTASRLRVSVRDTGRFDTSIRREHAPGEGHGLAGMRERAALYGGTVTAGPVPGGGWIVEAILDLTPLPSAAGGPQ